MDIVCGIQDLITISVLIGMPSLSDPSIVGGYYIFEFINNIIKYPNINLQQY